MARTILTAFDLYAEPFRCIAEVPPVRLSIRYVMHSNRHQERHVNIAGGCYSSPAAVSSTSHTLCRIPQAEPQRKLSTGRETKQIHRGG